MSKQAERDYPLRVDQRHLFTKPFDDPRVFREFTVVLELFRARLARGAILDLGCGPGWTSLLLARAGYRVLGADISQRMIEIARERALCDNVPAEFAVAEVEELDLGRDDFDGALFFDSLHHCPRYAEALRRAAAHLRPGGWLVLMETTWLHRYSPHARQAARHYGVTELGFTRRQLGRALRAAGLSGVTHYHDPGPCYRGAGGFLKAGLRWWCDYVFCYPQAKNIVVAQKV